MSKRRKIATVRPSGPPPRDTSQDITTPARDHCPCCGKPHGGITIDGLCRSCSHVQPEDQRPPRVRY